ncbi:MAG: response regulator, partial [Actinobacteria bacterium]|nr:response regulator [Actinomycetota bacterium]
MTPRDPSTKARILIAEDDPGVRTSLTRALGFQGYDVTAVNDGAAALAAVDRSLPDAVILDVSMP